MPIVVELPRLSDTMEEGVIAKWHIAVGDKVKRGQVIADVETDKAIMEFESFDAGTVLKVVVPEGEAMPIGTAIAVLGKPGEDAEAALAARKGGGSGGAASASAKATEAPAKATEAPAKGAEPAVGAEEEAAAALADAESEDTATADSKAKAGTTNGKQAPEAKAKADGKKAPAPEAKPPKAAAPAKDEPESADDGRIAASPLARRLAREHGIRLSEIPGSGPHGRIVKTDVEAAAARGPSEAEDDGAESSKAVGQVTASGRVFTSRPDQPQKLSQMRKAIARRMAQAKAEIPHFYLTTAIDMAASVALREELKKALPDTKISFNDLVLLGCAKALGIHPEVNAFWDGQTIVRRGDVHIGMAVAIDEGLIVPVIRFCDQKSLKEIAIEARDLGTRARDKKLTPQEMSGSTFTVSNLGMFGISDFSAVVNPGEGAILAVGAITDEIVPSGGQPTVGKRMRVTLSCDHRAMDGAIGAQFLATLRGLLEQPLSMLA